MRGEPARAVGLALEQDGDMAVKACAELALECLVLLEPGLAGDTARFTCAASGIFNDCPVVKTLLCVCLIAGLALWVECHSQSDHNLSGA